MRCRFLRAHTGATTKKDSGCRRQHWEQEEGFSLLAQSDAIAKGLGEVGCPFSRIRLLQRMGEVLFSPLVAACFHNFGLV